MDIPTPTEKADVRRLLGVENHKMYVHVMMINIKKTKVTRPLNLTWRSEQGRFYPLLTSTQVPGVQ